MALLRDSVGAANRRSLILTSVFAVSAVLSALVGVLLAGFSGADQSIGDPYLFGEIAVIGPP